jgi:hypothetical protein
MLAPLPNYCAGSAGKKILHQITDLRVMGDYLA